MHGGALPNGMAGTRRCLATRVHAMTSSDDKLSGEDRLIARYFKPLATAAGAFGLADDAAVIAPPPGHELVVTTDGLIAGVHFFEGEEAGHVARKAFRVNLSDLVAKGALPMG